MKQEHKEMFNLKHSSLCKTNEYTSKESPPGGFVVCSRMLPVSITLEKCSLTSCLLVKLEPLKL